MADEADHTMPDGDDNQHVDSLENSSAVIPEDLFDEDLPTTKYQPDHAVDSHAHSPDPERPFALPPSSSPDFPLPEIGTTTPPVPQQYARDPTASPIPAQLTRRPSPSLVVQPSPPNLGNSVLGKPFDNGKGKETNPKSTKDVQAALREKFLANNTTINNELALSSEHAGFSATTTPFIGTGAGHRFSGDHIIDRRADSPLMSVEEPQLDADEDAVFRDIEKAYNRKCKAGVQSIEEEIEYMKAKAKKDARARKLKGDALASRDLTPSEDDQLFMSDEEPENLPYSAIISDSADSEDDEEQGRAKKGRGRKRKATTLDTDMDSLASAAPKRRRAAPKKAGSAAKKGRKVNGHDYTEDDISEIVAMAKQRSNARINPNARTLAKGAKKGTVKGKNGRHKPGQATVTNVASALYGTDVFADAEEIQNLRSQPKLNHETRRDQQLKALVAGLPEADQVVGNADKRLLDRSIKDFNGGGNSVKAVPGTDTWLVKGMKTPLKAYQAIGVGFMRQRENGLELPRGGINADQMGLGKTISMLANIVNGKLAEDPKKRRPTLIVAAPALITQWRAEIQKHCKNEKEDKKYGLGTVIEHRAGCRVTSDDPIGILSKAHIILTTYTEISKSYPKAVLPPDLTTAQQKDQWWAAYLEEKKGILHRMKYHRVVLDEAQAIKNHQAHGSLAVRALDATHHWAITGTPILNTIKEFYPYFKFLRVPSTGSFKTFKENFCSPDDPDGTQKLAVFLNMFMVRRTHKDRLFNSRLLNLPTPRSHIVWIDFNEVERQIYEIVKNRMISRINHFSKAEGLQKNYATIWTMILRLRQMCGHILSIQETLADVLEREDFEKLNAITTSEEQLSDSSALTLIHLRNVLASNEDKKIIDAGNDGMVVTTSEAVPAGILDINETDEAALGGLHGLRYGFKKYMADLKNSDKFDEMNERSVCAACNSPPEDPQVTSCYHIYCEPCLRDLSHLSARRGHDGMTCKKCGEVFHFSKDLDDEDIIFDSSPSPDSPREEATKRGRSKRNKKKKNGDMEDWISMPGQILPSAKTAACKAQVLEWLKQDPNEKIIIFTQFINILRILAKVCQTEEWTTVQYHGGMSHDSRQKAIDDFADPEKGKQIMLASLKCGGLGLNLTMGKQIFHSFWLRANDHLASRVICFDPWWNEAVEQQAFCRVYRIGQTQETRLTRFLVKNTIDAAIQAVKERKQVEIDELMESAQERLNVKDLMRLFGPVAEDEEGHAFIFADDDDDVNLYRENDSGDERGFLGNDL